MKIALNADERKYLFGLLKLFAIQDGATNAAKGQFWLSLANRLGPNQEVCHLRRAEVGLLVDITSSAVEQLNKKLIATEDEGQKLRGQTLLKVLEEAKGRLEDKLKQNPIEGETNGT